ncbi:MAG TPA: DUF2255 family protein [Thermoanaerobaculia bacterium]|jgi:hypothetical protein|nr:DUF2255 family protein [Thermoanaerobaculia bacterium]
MNRFPDNVVTWIAKSKILGIRAGFGPHRIIGIWAVVVERRVFVRSWSMKERSWWRTLLEDPSGIIEVDGKQIPIRAVRTRSERLKDAIDDAYAAKYNTPGSLQYVKDFRTKKRRDTTTELVPA